jgi:hypothetical protein
MVARGAAPGSLAASMARTDKWVTVGINNRERQKAKQRAREERQRSRQERAGSADFPADSEGASAFAAIFDLPRQGPDVAQIVDSLAHQAVLAKDINAVEAAQRYRDALADGPGGAAARAVDLALIAIAQRELSAVWTRGWQPTDVLRVARRDHGARIARVVVDIIAGEMRRYATATVDERWEGQLREMDAAVSWERDDTYLSGLAEREGGTRTDAIGWLLDVLHVFATCPKIEMLVPPPGQGRRGSLGAAGADATAVDERKLDRVRALLAKAEATTFAEEAEAYSAKAQELMARHSIDYALLSASTGSRDEPIGRRIGIENPYEAPKVLLLDAVARANRCRAVWAQSFGFVTVLGFAADIAAVELLFTSLLVQATTVMMQAGKQQDGYGRSSTRSFRQSFLAAYAQRIGERLAAATEQVMEEAGRDLAAQPGGSQLLPVLAARDHKVDAMTEDLFPAVVSKHVASTNRDGWVSGRAAADRARLTAQAAVES